ncbi:MAG: hypothetical protein ACYSWP_11790 [Planctomycetota bacterium]
MKKIIIAIIIFLTALYFVLTSEKAQSLLDDLSQEHSVDLIQ